LNVAEVTGAPEDRERAEREVPDLLARIDRVLGHEPFRGMAHWRLRGGICWFAGQNLLRARYLRLARRPDPGQVERFHQDSATLAEAVRDSQTGALEAAPGLTWPVDSLFGYASLQIHDQLYGTHYGAGFEKWRASVERAADRRTHLAPSFLHLDGQARDVPRGCALSWSGAVLPSLAPAYAAEQWSSYREHFATCRWGLCLFREYPRGHDREEDVDSGPILFGYGMSATAFALAGARANGDAETAESLRRTGELLGFPSVSWWGKRYLGGTVELFDVLGLWARTVPYPAATAPVRSHPGPALALAALYLLLALWQWRALGRVRAQPAQAQDRSPVQAAAFAAQVGILVLHLAWPAFGSVLWLGGWVALDLLAKVLEGARSLLFGERATKERFDRLLKEVRP
jgi:hypothetical protein